MDANKALVIVLAELLDGPAVPGAAVVLNTGDAGLLGSLAQVSADEASRSVESAGPKGATLAAHAEHTVLVGPSSDPAVLKSASFTIN